METINIPSLKEGYEQYHFIKQHIDQIRIKRNECLSKTDYMMLNDIEIDEVKLNAVKLYRQELRDFVNKLMNDEIQCDIFLPPDEFVEKYFPKLGI